MERGGVVSCHLEGECDNGCVQLGMYMKIRSVSIINDNISGIIGLGLSVVAILTSN